LTTLILITVLINRDGGQSGRWSTSTWSIATWSIRIVVNINVANGYHPTKVIGKREKWQSRDLTKDPNTVTPTPTHLRGTTSASKNGAQKTNAGI